MTKSPEGAPAPFTAPKSIKVTLNTPITRDGPSITTLTLRKPSAGDLRGLSLQALINSDIDAIITLIPRISDPAIVAHEANRLEADDIAEVGGAIVGFFMSPAQRAAVEARMGMA